MSDTVITFSEEVIYLTKEGGMNEILVSAGFVLLGMVIELVLKPLSRVLGKN